MTKRILVATYDCEEGILAGARTARDGGIKIVDAYTPYAVHGLDKAMGLKPSRLTWVCFGLGAAAVVFMTWFQFWTSAVNWPINIGGKPWNSWPAFAPVIFESMVLCAGLGTVAVLFLVSRLLPGRKAQLIVEGVTNDRFALVVEHENAQLDLDEMRQIFEPSKPCVLEEQVLQEDAGCECKTANEPRWLSPVNVVLLGILAILAAFILLAPQKPGNPNWEIFSEMVRSPAAAALSDNRVLPGGITLQPPVPGTIARGRMPLHYAKTDESGVTAGKELKNPYRPGEDGLLAPGVRERGQKVFGIYCTNCHGATGAGDGPVVSRRYPAPPPFANSKAFDWPDGQIFHALTYGKGNMPSHAALVTRDDRWKVITYVRELLEKARTEAAKAEAEAAEAEAAAEAAAEAETKADTSKKTPSAPPTGESD